MSFSNLRETGVEQETDRVGGGYTVPDSDIYELEIKIGFLGKSQGGAQSITLLGTMNGQDIRETIYFTSGTEKGGGITYVNKKTGKKHYLPGYQALDDLALLATQGDAGLLDLLDKDLEEKVVKLYDAKEKKETNQSVQAVASFMGLKVKAAWLKKLEGKNAYSEVEKAYVPTGESRETGEISKFLSLEGFTVRELIAEADTAEFQEQWLKVNKGRVVDNFSKNKSNNSGTAGAPPAAGSSAGESATPRKKLFGKGA